MVTALKKSQAILSNEALVEKHVNRTGPVEGLLKQSPRGRPARTASSGNKHSQFFACVS